VSADPKSYSAHYNLGLVLANQSRWGEALGSLRQALALEPGSARTRCKVGLVLDKMGKRDEAIAEYRKALELDPANAEAKEALTALGVRP
jgi:Flp pilus assembly protein TadD